MKCEAAAIRRRLLAQSSCAVATSPASAARRAERVEREDLDRGVVVAAGVVEDRDEPSAAPGTVGGVERREQALAERGLLAAAGVAVPRGRPPRAPTRASSVRPSARRTRPRCTRASAAMRTSPVASAFSIASSSVAAPAS